jgi:hypothetical protein
MAKICIATNYEFLGPPQVAIWNRLAQELAQRDVQLVLLTKNAHPELALVYIVIPYALQDFLALNVPNPPEVARLDAMLAIEALWQNPYLPDESRRGAKICRGFYQRLLEVLEPDSVLIWNTLAPHSRILQLLCHEEEIPVFSFERGQLPGTLLCDTLRNNSASELNTSIVIDSFIATYESDGSTLARYRQWYHRTRPEKYVAASDASVVSLEAMRQSGKPIVTVFGQALGAGILPRTDALARRNFPHFNSVGEILSTLAKVDDCALAFRDHPINVGLQKGTDLPEGTVRAEAAPLLRVLKLTDVAVVLGSTSVLYEALLLRKPVLVLGNTPVARFEPYYGARDLPLPEALRRARAGGWEGIRERAEKALSFLLEHSLIANHPDVPARRGLAELAGFLASFDLASSRSLEDRVGALERFAAAV